MPIQSNDNAKPRIAIVTGGSRGLGRNTALALAERGVDTIITYHSNLAEADNTVSAIAGLGRKAVALQLDTGDSSQFDGFVGRVRETLSANWQRATFDHLVNNAGTALYSPIPETTEEQMDAMYRIHFKGVFFLTQKLLPLLADGGRIINVSSGLARMTQPGSSVYGSMKAAIETMTRYMAKELGPRGITVNVVAPGAIETDFGGGRVRDTPDLNKAIAGATALGRVGVPDDIGPMIASLLDDANRWVTAQRIEASGGMYL